MELVGQRVLTDNLESPQTIDGCEYKIERAQDGTYYYLLSRYPEDVIADGRYFLDVSSRRFCELLGYFVPESDLVKFTIAHLPIEEINGWLSDINREIAVQSRVEHSETYKDLMAQKFAMLTARLVRLSEERIDLLDEYRKILADDNREQRYPEIEAIYNKSRANQEVSDQTFLVLDAMKDESFLRVKTSDAVDPMDIDYLIYEAISEIYKMPPVRIGNPQHEIPTLERFDRIAKRSLAANVYINRDDKTANACRGIDLVAEKMLAAAVRVDVGPSKELLGAINELAASAKSKTGLPERHSAFKNTKTRFEAAKAKVKIELMNLSGFAATASPSAMRVINKGLEIIEKSTDLKRQWKTSTQNLQASVIVDSGMQRVLSAVS